MCESWLKQREKIFFSAIVCDTLNKRGDLLGSVLKQNAMVGPGELGRPAKRPQCHSTYSQDLGTGAAFNGTFLSNTIVFSLSAFISSAPNFLVIFLFLFLSLTEIFHATQCLVLYSEWLILTL